jgi:hypothetical protein
MRRVEDGIGGGSENALTTDLFLKDPASALAGAGDFFFIYPVSSRWKTGSRLVFVLDPGFRRDDRKNLGDWTALILPSSFREMQYEYHAVACR